MGTSANEASKNAVGNSSLTSNLKTGKSKSLSLKSTEAVCRALGLDFYIGEPRERYDPVKSPRVSLGRTGDQVSVWEISDEHLWALIGAFAEEWAATDEAGQEKTGDSVRGRSFRSW